MPASAGQRPSHRRRARATWATTPCSISQRQTFRYFWDFAHPVSGLARERSNVMPHYGHEAVATGGAQPRPA